MNYGFIIDNRKCIGCHACTVACKAEHDVPIGVNRTWVKYIEKGEYPNSRRVFSVMRCNHCEDAPCVEICPVEALHTRDDGIVDFDNRRCIGCKACMQACPYDALYIDPHTHTAAKCNYCSHRVDIGLEPACVNVCPEHAIISGDLDDPTSEIAILFSREQVSARKVEKGTKPKLFYINGDEASLTPTLAAQSTEYLWNSQATGVGHFAKYAEALLAKSNPVEMAQMLGGAAAVDSNSGVVMPAGAESNDGEEKNVIRGKARRVYDAPGKGVLWGWEVSAYVWTKAIAAGAFLVPFLALTFGFTGVPDAVQWSGLGGGLIFLTLTGLLLVKDLDQPARFAYVLLRPQWRSWLVRGGYAITFYGGLLTLWGVARWLGWQGVENVALWGSALFAIITAIYTAFLFAQAKGRDFWQSPMLALHMFIQSIVAGGAAFAILTLAFGNAGSWNDYLRTALLSAVVVNLVIITSELVTPHPTSDAKAVVKMIVSGKFKNQFWWGALLIGNVVPLLLLWFGGGAAMALSGVLLLIGIYLTEHIWVRAPQLIQLS